MKNLVFVYIILLSVNLTAKKTDVGDMYLKIKKEIDEGNKVGNPIGKRFLFRFTKCNASTLDVNNKFTKLTSNESHVSCEPKTTRKYQCNFYEGSKKTELFKEKVGSSVFTALVS